jgi:hypothetical protein
MKVIQPSMLRFLLVTTSHTGYQLFCWYCIMFLVSCYDANNVLDRMELQFFWFFGFATLMFVTDFTQSDARSNELTNMDDFSDV